MTRGPPTPLLRGETGVTTKLGGPHQRLSGPSVQKSKFGTLRTEKFLFLSPESDAALIFRLSLYFSWKFLILVLQDSHIHQKGGYG
jgi:hypothetical protein